MIYQNILSFMRWVWRVFYAPILLLVVHFALHFGVRIYDTLPWFDIPMHFLGGAIVAFSTSIFLNDCEKWGLVDIRSSWLFGFFIITLVAWVAVLWEFHEFGLDYFFHTASQASLADTMGDLFLGIFGAGVSAGVLLLYSRLGESTN